MRKGKQWCNFFNLYKKCRFPDIFVVEFGGGNPDGEMDLRGELVELVDFDFPL